jgi:hypothetical protein
MHIIEIFFGIIGVCFSAIVATELVIKFINNLKQQKDGNSK